MDEFRVVFTNSAEKDINQFSPSVRLSVLQAVKTLEINPFPRGNVIKKLKGSKTPLYRLRVGDYRVIFRISDKCVEVFAVIDRKDLEQALRNILRRN